MEVVVGFVLAAFALTGSPGPNTLSVAGVGAAYGWRNGVAYMLGLSGGMLGVIALVGTGMVGLLLAVPGAALAVSLLAATYFVYLAWRIATAPPLNMSAVPAQPPSPWAAMLVSLSNPKAYAAIAALFSGFVLVEASPLVDPLVKTILLMVIILTVNLFWLLAGSSLTGLMRDPKWSRAINIGFAVLLLISVGAALLL